MLMNVALLHHDPAPHQRPEFPQVAPIKILRAHSLAHRKLAKWQRARLAAAWLDNGLLLVPTLELASEVFDVSNSLIAKERTRPASLPLGMLAYGWLKSSLAERDAFCRQHEAGIWAALELVADCQR